MGKEILELEIFKKGLFGKAQRSITFSQAFQR